ncbi:MAG: phasin family protein [Rhodobiaceae bacterium]|nr:phasin family protein [Rhodobiaceae bacterium]
MTTIKKTGAQQAKPTNSLEMPMVSAQQWMENWCDPSTFEKFRVSVHAGDLGASSIDHAEHMTHAIFKFMDERLRKDFDTMRELAECREPSALARIQAEFWQTAWNDYRDFMMRMGDEVTELANDTEEVINETSDDAAKALREIAAD